MKILGPCQIDLFAWYNANIGQGTHEEWGEVVLVTPVWPAQPWYPLFYAC